jgi:ABC-type uncharacterized transport system ATPase subunit
MVNALCVSGLRYRYHASESEWLLDIEQLEIAQNTAFSLLGDNMTGKTTLLQLIAGTLPSQYGQCRGLLQWRDLSIAMPVPAPAMRRRGLAMLHQNDPMFPPLSVAENLALYAPEGTDRRSAFRAAHEKLEIFRELLQTKVSDRMPLGSLSGGAQALMRLLRVLAWKHRVVFLDEPTVNLDQENRNRAFLLLGQLLADGASVVLVSHLSEDHYRLREIAVAKGMQRVQWRLVRGHLQPATIE